jgi:hypothetical protein
MTGMAHTLRRVSRAGTLNFWAGCQSGVGPSHLWCHRVEGPPSRHDRTTMTKSMLIMRPSDETGSNIEILEFDELLATFGQVHGVSWERIGNRHPYSGFQPHVAGH